MREPRHLYEKFDPQWLYSTGYWKKFTRWVKKGRDSSLASTLSAYKTLLEFITEAPWSGEVLPLWHEWIASTGGRVRHPSPPPRY